MDEYVINIFLIFYGKKKHKIHIVGKDIITFILTYYIMVNC